MTEAAIKQRRDAATKHGGAGAVRSIQQGAESLPGTPARDAELAVCSELENNGRYSLVVRNATRLQAPARDPEGPFEGVMASLRRSQHRRGQVDRRRAR